MKKFNSDEYLEEQEGQEYVNGLKCFQVKGIPAFIDGERASEEDRGKIFMVRGNGSFYMSDYVGMEEGALCEIRFGRVCNR